jgi:RNA polymerase sigma-70 factor (ECF subfamily)
LEPSDASLVRRWRRGDGKAAAVAVARYTDALGAVAFAILGNPSLAEEVVQETFARAAERITHLKDADRLGAWLVGIARHVALDLFRRRVRERSLTAHTPTAPANPGREAARAETAERLRGVVAGLPEDQRDIFAMKYVAGMSYADIGKTLGMTPEAVGQKLWRVRQKLQLKLKEFRP